MQMFTVRVELHDADYADYEQLHTAMEAAGFSRLITSDDGRTFRMPWAEYNRVSTESLDVVTAKARRAADSTGRRNAVLANVCLARCWEGLDQISRL